MAIDRTVLLGSYHYDALDRLTGASGVQRFYLGDHLRNEIEDATRRTIFQHGTRLLAQRQLTGGTDECTLLATDHQRSTLHVCSRAENGAFAYAPYGYLSSASGLTSLLGFNGERRDPITGHYLLGNGYRAFNPVLMRFNSPDSWSPFGRGGLNAYAYSLGDPANGADPTGHMPKFLPKLLNIFPKSAKTMASPPKASKVTPNYSPMRNINFISEDAYYFTDTFKGQDRLNIVGHGSPKGKMKVGELRLSAEDLHGALGDTGMTFKDQFSTARILSCYSADSGFAEQFAQFSGLPTKGYSGGVITSHDTQLLRKRLGVSAGGEGTNQGSAMGVDYRLPLKISKKLSEVLPELRQGFSFKSTTFYPR